MIFELGPSKCRVGYSVVCSILSEKRLMAESARSFPRRCGALTLCPSRLYAFSEPTTPHGKSILLQSRLGKHWWNQTSGEPSCIKLWMNSLASWHIFSHASFKWLTGFHDGIICLFNEICLLNTKITAPAISYYKTFFRLLLCIQLC